MENILTCKFPSPLGELTLASYAGSLVMCDFGWSPRHQANCRRLAKGLGAEFTQGDSPVLEQARRELEAYFAGSSAAFRTPLRFVGTPFQCRVWEQLTSIPYGTAITYAQQAEELGCPSAVRAVAAANGSNSIAIFAPCHRVVGSGGKLTGYAGGLDRKQLLLDIEGAVSIRRAVPEDLPEMQRLFACARAFMKKSGNPTQWGDNRPPASRVEADIAAGNSYVCSRGGRLVATFALVPGADPTYAQIDGAWLHERPYSTLHRVASDGTIRGVSRAIFAWSRAHSESLRIDTHKDNGTILRIIEREGFIHCGRIVVDDGTLREAFQEP